jgi:tyrosyl-tRNA synthetase
MELARKIVALYHGAKAAAAAEKEFVAVFQKKEPPQKITTFAAGKNRLSIVQLMRQAKLVTSNGEARRLIQQGAVHLDNKKITDPKSLVSVKVGSILRLGKHRFAKVGRI